MRISMLLLMSLILAGCAGNKPREIPDWGAVEIPQTEVTDPVALPLLCEMTVIDGADGVRYGTWSPECWQAFQAYELVAEANYKISQANAGALRDTEGAYKSLVSAGQMQQQLTEFYNDMYEDEKDSHRWDNWFYRILIGLGLLVVVL